MTALEAGGQGTVNEKPGNSGSSLDIISDEARPLGTELERQVLRKIDWFLMPAMVIGTVAPTIIYTHFRY